MGEMGTATIIVLEAIICLNEGNMNRFSIKPVTKYSAGTLAGLNALLLQWDTKRQLKPGYFTKLLKHSYLLCLYDGKKMIGAVTLVPLHKISGVKGSIEHLIVDQEYRGRGLGKKLMKEAVSYAKKLGMEGLQLTCNPKRNVANALYRKLGFKLQKTNFYLL